MSIVYFTLQTYSQCTAEVDPIMVACIPDLDSFMQSINADDGMASKIEPSGNMILTGSLLQLQCAQAKLHDIYKEQQELQQRELFHLGSVDTPRGHPPTANSLGATQPDLDKNLALSLSSSTADGAHTTPAQTYTADDYDTLQNLTAKGFGIQSLNLEDKLMRSTQVKDKRLIQSMPPQISGVDSQTVPPSRAPAFTGSIPATSEVSTFLRHSNEVDELFASGKAIPKWSTTSTQSSSIRSSLVDDDFSDLGQGRSKLSKAHTDGSSGLSKDRKKTRSRRDAKSATTSVSTLKSPADQFVTAEVDALVFRYLTLKNAEALLQMEKDLQVKMQYKRQGEITSIRIMPVAEEIGVSAMLAKEKLVSLYQTVFYSVIKETMTVKEGDKAKQQHFEKIIKQVAADYKGDLVVEQESDTEVTLVGKKFHVLSAVEYMKKILGMRARGRDMFDRPDRAQTARDVVKPKMIFMMQSQPAMPTYEDEDPLTLSSKSEQVSANLRQSHTQSILEEMIPEKERTVSQGSKDSTKSGRSDESRLTEVSQISRGSRSRGASVRTAQTGTSVWSMGTDQSLTNTLPTGNLLVTDKTRQQNMQTTADMFFDSLEPSSVAQAQASAASVLPSVAESSDFLSTQGSIMGMATRRMLDTGGSTQAMLTTHNQSPYLASSLSLSTKYSSFQPVGGFGAFHFDTREGVRVAIYQGDLTTERTDVIVNAAREDLHLLSGVSGALSNAVGPSLQRECTKYVVKNGNMKVNLI